MKQKKTRDKAKDHNVSSSAEKTKSQLISGEKFNTGSHTPSALRNVGAGYDDTGLGDYTKANETNAGNVKSRQSKTNRKTGKK